MQAALDARGDTEPASDAEDVDATPVGTKRKKASTRTTSRLVLLSCTPHLTNHSHQGEAITGHRSV